MDLVKFAGQYKSLDILYQCLDYAENYYKQHQSFDDFDYSQFKRIAKRSEDLYLCFNLDVSMNTIDGDPDPDSIFVHSYTDIKYEDGDSYKDVKDEFNSLNLDAIQVLKAYIKLMKDSRKLQRNNTPRE